MSTIEVFEAPMSVKGPADKGTDFIHKEFASRLRWLESKGVKVQNHVPPQDGTRLSMNSTVKSALEAQGPDCLPIVVVDDNIITVGGYPTPIELMEAIGGQAVSDPEFFGDIAVEAAALGAAIAVNDFLTFQRQWEHLRSLGIRDIEATRAVQSAIATVGSGVRDDMRTRVEQLIAFGPQGKPPKSQCACGKEM